MLVLCMLYRVLVCVLGQHTQPPNNYTNVPQQEEAAEEQAVEQQQGNTGQDVEEEVDNGMSADGHPALHAALRKHEAATKAVMDATLHKGTKRAGHTAALRDKGEEQEDATADGADGVGDDDGHAAATEEGNIDEVVREVVLNDEEDGEEQAFWEVDEGETGSGGRAASAGHQQDAKQPVRNSNEQQEEEEEARTQNTLRIVPVRMRQAYDDDGEDDPHV